MGVLRGTEPGMSDYRGKFQKVLLVSLALCPEAPKAQGLRSGSPSHVSLRPGLNHVTLYGHRQWKDNALQMPPPWAHLQTEPKVTRGAHGGTTSGWLCGSRSTREG